MKAALALVAALLPTGAASAITLTVDQSKGDCDISRKPDALHVTCPVASEPSISLAVATIAPAKLRGADAVLFVIPVPAGEPVSVARISSGWSLGIPSARTAPVVSPSPAPESPRVALPMPQVPQPGKAPATSAGSAPKTAATPGPATTTADADRRANDLVARLKDLQLDYSIPDMPAFTVVGMTPENVSHPRTSRALAVAIRNGLDENGKVKAGLALDFQPFRLSNPEALLKSYVTEAVQHKKYERNTLPQMLYNSSISLATAQGTSADDKSTKLGLGLKIPIFDKSDGRTDIGLIQCYEKVKSLWLAATTEAEEEAATKGADSCFKNRSSAKWNASAWTVSLGSAWTSDSGNFSDRKASTRGIWTTYGYGFDDEVLFGSSQLIFHLRALDNERVPKPNEAGKFQNQDSRAAGIGFKFGNDAFNASIQGSYQTLKVEGAESTDKVRRVALGLEYKVAQDVWLVATLGGEGGRKNGEDKSFVLAGFRFAPSSKPVFSPGP